MTDKKQWSRREGTVERGNGVGWIELEYSQRKFRYNLITLLMLSALFQHSLSCKHSAEAMYLDRYS